MLWTPFPVKPKAAKASLRVVGEMLDIAWLFPETTRLGEELSQYSLGL
jgi:hypothetical protein